MINFSLVLSSENVNRLLGAKQPKTPDLARLDVPYPGVVPEEAIGYNSNRGETNVES